MATTFTSTAFNSTGTSGGSNLTYKDVTVTVGSGDLIIAAGASANANGSGVGSLATQSGSTGSWTVGYSNNTSESPGYIIGHAVASAAGSVTVRVTVATASDMFMGAAVWVVSAADVTGTPSYTSFGPNVSDPSPSVTLSPVASKVFYAGIDWSAGGDPGNSATPAGVVNDTTFFVSGNYGGAFEHWDGQGAGTRDYGPSAPPGNQWTGAVVKLEEVTTQQATGMLWGSGTPVTAQSNGSWAGATNATGPNDGVRATWTSTASGSNGSIRVEGHGAQAAIGAEPASVDQVSVTVYAYTTNTTRMASIAVQLTDSGSLIGSAQTMTKSTSTSFSQTFTFTGVTWANLANLGVRVLFTRGSVTTAATGNVDAVGINVTYTPATGTTNQVTGTIAATSAAAGDISKVAPGMAGTVAAATSVAAAIALKAAPVGTAAATSAAVGATSLAAAATGVAAGAAGASGTVTAQDSFAGAVAATSSIAGAVAALLPGAAGDVAANSSVAGAVAVVRPIEGGSVTDPTVTVTDWFGGVRADDPGFAPPSDGAALTTDPADFVSGSWSRSSSPAWRSDMGGTGQPAFLFPAGDAQLFRNAWAGSLTDATYFIVGRVTSTSGGDLVDSGGGGLRRLVDSDGASWRIYAGDTVLSGGTADTSVHAFFAEFRNAGDETLYVDNVQVVTGASGSNVPADIWIGSSANGSHNGSEVAFVGIAPRILTSTERDALFAWYQAVYLGIGGGAGGAAAVSSVVGDVSLVPSSGTPVSGVVEAVAGSAGAVTLEADLAGSAGVTTSVVGSISPLRPAAATVPAQTGLTGQLTLDAEVSGSTVATSTVSGEVTIALQTYAVEGTAAASSQTAGAVSRLAPTSGAVDANVGAVGEVVGVLAPVGVVEALTSVDGTPTAWLYPSGQVDAISSASGNLDGSVPVVGTVAGVSEVVGSVVLYTGVAGSADATSSASGEVSLVEASVLSVSGTVAASTASTGAVAKLAAAAEAVPAVTAVSGSPTAWLYAAGAVAGTAAVAGAPTSYVHVSGSVDAVSEVHGSTDGRFTLPVSGIVTVTSSSSAVVVLVGTATSVAIGATSSQGSVSRLVPATGGLDVEGGVVGDAAAILRAAAAAAISGAVEGSVAGLLRAQGLVAGVTALADALTAYLGVAGQVDAVATVSGTVIRIGEPPSEPAPSQRVLVIAQDARFLIAPADARVMIVPTDARAMVVETRRAEVVR